MEMQEVAATIFEVAWLQRLMQELSDGRLKEALEWLYLNGLCMVTQQGVQYCSILQNMDLFFNGRNDVRWGLVFTLA